MISLILFAIACCIEAIMDRMYEVYKLGIINTKEEKLNGNWFSYNPLSPEKGLGIMRDGWHFLKFIHYILIIIGTVSIYFDPIYISWYVLLIGLIITRSLFFNLTLKIARKKITTENNFKSI